MPDPPYLEIADSLREGNVVPFLGAGVNFGTRPLNTEWNDPDAEFLPTAAELSGYLARRTRFPSQDLRERGDLAKVASYFVDTVARSTLRARLRHIFARTYQPASIHTYLAKIARKTEAEIKKGEKPGTPLLMVTTNYDDLLERAFQHAGRPYDLVVYPTDSKDIAASVLWLPYGESEPEAVLPNQLCIDLKTTNVIYKMHGSVDQRQKNMDSYVITEEDYIEFLSRMTTQSAVPAQFMRYFRERHFLFLGYGLADWNFRVLLRNLRNVLPAEAETNDNDKSATVNGIDHEEVTSWAIQYRPSELEDALWRARKVRIFDKDIKEFVASLEEEGQ
jgi:hypothetical protein